MKNILLQKKPYELYLLYNANMNSPNLINSINDCYKALVVTGGYWNQPSTDLCEKVLKFLNEYILNNQNDARAYYLRSMAKFQLSGLYRNFYNKDDAFNDYITAININPDVVSNTLDVRVIMVSHETALKYYFRRPVNSKVFNSIMGVAMTKIANTILLIIGLLFIGLFFYFIFKYNSLGAKFLCLIFIFLSLIVLFFINIFFGECIKKISQNIAKKYCEEVVRATYDEWHG